MEWLSQAVRSMIESPDWPGQSAVVMLVVLFALWLFAEFRAAILQRKSDQLSKDLSSQPPTAQPEHQL